MRRPRQHKFYPTARAPMRLYRCLKQIWRLNQPTKRYFQGCENSIKHFSRRDCSNSFLHPSGFREFNGDSILCYITQAFVNNTSFVIYVYRYFFHSCCPLFLSIHKYMYEYTKNNNTCMFSLFQHFVFSLSLLFFEKNIFFCFFGVYFVFLFFSFFFKIITISSLVNWNTYVWGINKAKSKKPCKKSIFFSPESKCHL